MLCFGLRAQLASSQSDTGFLIRWGPRESFLTGPMEAYTLAQKRLPTLCTSANALMTLCAFLCCLCVVLTASFQSISAHCAPSASPRRSSYLGRRFLNTTNASDTWGSLAFALVYWSSAGSFDDVNALPASADYRERFVGMLRSKWTPIPTIDDNQPTTRNATFVAFKGGNQTWNHGHLDQGSFVVDIQGTRWAEDLGSGSYALPGYFGTNGMFGTHAMPCLLAQICQTDKRRMPIGSDRWKYYRTNSTGHNVLQFDGENQALTAVSPISVNITGNFGTANLSEAYAQHADTVIRGYALTVDPDGTGIFGACLAIIYHHLICLGQRQPLCGPDCDDAIFCLISPAHRSRHHHGRNPCCIRSRKVDLADARAGRSSCRYHFSTHGGNGKHCIHCTQYIFKSNS